MNSLAVVEPTPLFRISLAALVAALGFEPVEDAADLNELMGLGDGDRPELMIVGLRGAAAEIAPMMREIRAWAPETKVVFLAQTLDIPALIACFAAGARGYLIESLSREGLKHSLRLACAGENVFPSALADALRTSSVNMSGPEDIPRDLYATKREMGILRCLANGETNHVIAEKLGISETAVRADIRQLLRKLHLSNRTQAALWAVARGLAPPLAGPEARH
jgi:two-component system nitrate/nitrite response regulator NarL